MQRGKKVKWQHLRNPFLAPCPGEGREWTAPLPKKGQADPKTDPQSSFPLMNMRDLHGGPTGLAVRG